MVCRAFRDPLALLLGAPGGLFGGLLGLQMEQKGLTTIELATSWALFGLCSSLLAAEDGLESVTGPYWAPFGCSLGPLGSSFGALRSDFELPN